MRVCAAVGGWVGYSHTYALTLYLNPSPGHCRHAVMYSHTCTLHPVTWPLPPSPPTTPSGLEASAVGGEGYGIEMFRPPKKMMKLSNKMFIPLEALDRLKEEKQRLASSKEASTSGQRVNPGEAVQVCVCVCEDRGRARLLK